VTELPSGTGDQPAAVLPMGNRRRAKNKV
jgi:hypothetical protein